MSRSFKVVTKGAGKVKLYGVEELKRALEEVGTEVATKIGVKADRKAAQAFRDELRLLAPYDPRNKVRRLKSGKIVDYGHLRDQIKVRRAKARKQGHIVFNVTVGTAFWGRFHEFGTVNQPPRPWMRPAFERLRSKLLDVQLAELRVGLKSAAELAARRNGVRKFGRVDRSGRNV
jgi:HK97 gp10 family phage protein